MKKGLSLLLVFCLWTFTFYFFSELLFAIFSWPLGNNQVMAFVASHPYLTVLLLSIAVTIFCYYKKWDPFKQLGIAKRLLCYYLGINMLPYGISKIMQTQFVVLPFSAWQRKLEDLSGTTLAWAFLGYSPNLQILLGVLEFIPSILLLFRRTAFLGVILMLPMTLNVFLINYALDLWEGTKTLSMQFLIVNIFLVVIEWKKIKAILDIVIGKFASLKYFGWEALVAVAVCSVILVPSISQLLDYRRQINVLTGDWLHQHPNEWMLKSQKMNDSILPEVPKIRSYFQTDGVCMQVSDTGQIANGFTRYNLDENKKIIRMYKHEGDSVLWSYNMINDSTMETTQILDSMNNRMISIYNRRVINK